MTLTRAERTERRNRKIQDAFYKRFTLQPRIDGVKIYTREGVLAQLAHEFDLSMTTVERIVFRK